MLYAEWRSLRNKINHDWLQNKFRLFLKLLQNDNSSGLLKQDILDRLMQWDSRRLDLISLMSSAPEALSPRQLLCRPPLDKMDEGNKEWLGELIHELYLARSGIAHKVNGIYNLIVRCDKLVSVAKDQIMKEDCVPLLTADKLLYEFKLLSRKISDLPHQIELG